MLSRRTFSAAATALPIVRPRLATPTPHRRIPCGIDYDAGTNMLPGISTREPADFARMEKELTAVLQQLHCTDVCILGSDADALLTGVNTALNLGLEVRMQARLNDTPLAQVTDTLATLGRELQVIADNGGAVVFDIGCELLLFADGLIPGNSFDERFAFVMSEEFSSFPYPERLNEMLRSMTEAARTAFAGDICYSTVPEDPVDWSLVDIIGIDHYRDGTNMHTYADIIRSFSQYGKPVWVNEFGACPYTGAAQTGGMGWDEVVDWWADPPRVQDNVERNEQEQAEAIIATLEDISTTAAEKAFLYQFIEPGAPHSNDHERDYDLAGYGIVNCWDDTHPQPYATTGHWEPKLAFEAVAAWNLKAR